ncbi:MAG: helix-turn-helix domain-containing protein [Alphaproteobacteria bacterium]|jgi:predicted DNA-binding transcriptional regulator AlpA|nr:helix-turn-helix domain-containing protein [Alphaproteobacteria bacterium]
MEEYLLHNLAELAERRARNVREEAMMWDILSRDLKREAKRREERAQNKPAQPKMPPPEDMPNLEDRLYVRIKEACKIMGLGHTSIYKEINEGRLPVKKADRKTMVAMKDIHAWFDALPDKE